MQHATIRLLGGKIGKEPIMLVISKLSFINDQITPKLEKA